ncbi:hypothetical protein CRV06_00910 [Halarcobacter anaerophilus]|uniref:HTH araC/xylS-type domain-containing protein n=1 Tax=Halarcobacter anaerophilus TaxID=877500 RepID=A0A4V1LQF8_9BACT|nr:hypothetical protein CRV06_00910 [Halarcobacter anaerophilus]
MGIALIEFESFTPEYLVSKYIKCYWMIKGNNNLSSYNKTILPHNEVCMTFLIGKESIETSKNKNSINTGIYVSLASSKNYSIDFKDKFHYVDVSFYPGVFYELFKIPLDKLESKLYSIDELCIKMDKSILETLYEKKDNNKETVNILNNYFSKLFYRLDENQFLNNIKNLCINSNLEEFYNNSRLSTRQIQRETKKFTGMTPRTIQRISRFYKILEQLKYSSNPNFATIAQNLDFYDQSHLIKDFKSFSGLNLKDFIQTNSNYLQFQSKEYCHNNITI